MRPRTDIACTKCPSKEDNIFCNLSNDELKELNKSKIINRYTKGQGLFYQGTSPFGIYCICQGKIKIYKTDQDGKFSIIRIASRGDIIGHRGLFSKDQYYGVSATAMEESTVCFIEKQLIFNTIRDKPCVAMNLIEKISQEMSAIENKVLSLNQKNVRERVAELLLCLKESYGVRKNDKWYLDIKLGREEMASMVGIANETLTRLLSEFREDNIISKTGKTIYINKVETLIEYANLSY